MQTVSVALIDTNRLFREGLKVLISGSDFRIVAEAGTLAEAVSTWDAADGPGAVLLDPAGTADAARTVCEVRAAFPGARVVLLTTELDAQSLAAVLEAGADAYLLKDISPEALVQSLNLVMLGEKVFPSHLSTLLMNHRMHADGRTPRFQRGLSGREVEILRHLLDGDSNKMIANHLGITEATVKVHLKSLIRKIGASNRTQAAIWALNNGLGETAKAVAVG